MEKIICSAASHLKFNVKGYVQHIQPFHAHHSSFRVTCGINGCQKTYTNFGTFSQHVYSFHYESSKAVCRIQSEGTTSNLKSFDNSDVSNGETDDAEDVDQLSHSVQDIDYYQELCYSKEHLQKCSGTFLLGLKEKFKLTQVALQSVIQDVSTLYHENVIGLKAQVCVTNFWVYSDFSLPFCYKYRRS